MTGCPDDEQLARVADGTGSDEDRATVLGHVDSCAACLRTLAGAAAGAGDAAPAPAIGDRLGRFTITSVLGTGAMGIVYEARDPELERTVALKLLRRDRELDPIEAVERLRAEARAIARVTNPHVVAVHDIGTSDGHVFIAMEHVTGVTLRAWLAASPRTTRAIVDAFVQAARGLAAAHEAGVIHRDFKPDNVLVGDDGRVRVGDFGLARHHADTSTAIAGTPAYMAPEQRTGATITAASDQYGFCVALAEALTGERPRGAAVVGRLPDRLRRVIERGLADDPARRWPTMAALAHALAPWSGPGRVRARLAIAGAVAIAAIGGGTIAWYATRAPAPPACDDGATTIAELWRPPRTTAIAGALGDAGFREVDRSIGRFAASWAATHDATCRAGRAAPVATTECLTRARADADALLALLADAKATEVDVAREAIHALPDPARCVREGASTIRTTPLPASALAFEQRLSHVRAEFELGRLVEARRDVEPLIAEAEANAQPSLAIHARLLHAATNAILDAPRTIEELRLVLPRAIAARDDFDLADCLIGLTDAYARTNHHDQAEVMLELADAHLARLGGDPRRAATGATGLCLFGWQRGPDFTKALAACDAARARVLADTHEPDDVRLTWIDTELANIAVADNRFDEAIAIYDRNIAYRVGRHVRPEHHALIADRTNRGIALFEAKRYREAIAGLSEVVAVAPDNLAAWDHLGPAHHELGEHAAAYAAELRALAIAEPGTDAAMVCALALDAATYGLDAHVAVTSILDRAAARCREPADVAKLAALRQRAAR